MNSSDRISPTAHYTGYVWARNGLSHPELQTREGRVLYESWRPADTVNGRLGRDSLEQYLLARHRALDLVLDGLIAAGTVTQVIEVACGLSPRGWRFAQKYGDALTYVEADLPGMASRKRRALTRMGSLSGNHRVVEIDALRDEGPQSPAGVADWLDRRRGLAIITEGLLAYLDRESVDGMWRRFATVLGEFAGGRYLTDMSFRAGRSFDMRAFYVMLGVFVRGSVHAHFENPQEALDALRTAGFAGATATPATDLVAEAKPRGGRRVHILEASTVAST
jgi:O-methyltransferase involved in polyketide biosynthesis